MAASDVKLLSDQGYDFVGDIGEGAYSKVKLFYSKVLGHHVAIKIINRQLTPRDFVKNFLPREIDILQKVKHPNIVDCYEILATSDGRIFIVLEYSRYNDLLRHIQAHGPIEEQRAKYLFGQLVEAIAYLHQNGIVHRDLKCENLLLTDSSVIKSRNNISNLQFNRQSNSDSIDNFAPNKKISPLPLNPTFEPTQIKMLLTDFGFSREFKPGDRSKTFCGSAAYAAPEIIQGQPYALTSHDIWALGVILFIMVCGTMPYDDSNIRQMVKEQLAHKIRFPPKIAYKLSVSCKELISKLIEPNSEKRLNISQVQQHPWLSNRLIYSVTDEDAIFSSSNISKLKSKLNDEYGRSDTLPEKLNKSSLPKSKEESGSVSGCEDIFGI